MNIYDAFGTDRQQETSGIQIDYGELGKIRIARAGGANQRFDRALTEKMRPYRRQAANGTLSEEVSLRILAEVYADTVVLGWEGLTGPDGQPLEFSRGACVKLFHDLPELFLDIRQQATLAANFRAAALEADEKK